MSGYEDALIVTAPAMWWPSLADVAAHPLLPARSFCAMVADSAAPHPTTAAAEGQTTYGLSRLGRSVFLGARWRDGDGDGDNGAAPDSCVEVFDPVTGGSLVLDVAQYPPEDDTPLFELARAGRIRLRPRSVPAPTAPQPEAALEQRCLEVLLQRPMAEVFDASAAFLRSGSRRPPRRRVHATLVTGDAGVGKRTFLELLRRRLPAALCVRDGGGATTTHVFEHRALNFREILALDAREAVQCVRAALQPIPHSDGPPRGGGHAVAAAIVVALHHVDLLWAGRAGTALTDAVSGQLCASIDDIGAAPQSNPTVVFLWSTATQPAAMAPALRQRLATQHIHLTPPTAEQRRECLLLRLQQRGAGPAAPRLVEQLVEGTAHLSAWQLTRCSVEGVAETAEAAGSDDGAIPYGHLFHVERQVAALEALVVWPLTHRPLLRGLGVPCAKGVLVCGPSGSGKTALLSALAQRLRASRACRGVHVMAVDGLSLIEKEVGRSEKNIAELFAAARAHAPTALFLDNLDALAPPRDQQSGETTTATDRTLSTLLAEMDGVGGDPDSLVVVVASAPDPARMDAAVRRPGRLDVHLRLEAPPPDVRAAAIHQRVMEFLAVLLPTAGAAVAGGGAGEWPERLLELEEAAVRPAAAAAAARASSAAETVAAARELILAAQAAVASAAVGGAAPVAWPQWREQLASALHCGRT